MTTTVKKPGIIIADKQYFIVEALRNILADLYEITGVVSCKSELISNLENSNPDILILDYSMLDFTGIDELKELKKINPVLTIVILTNNISANQLYGFRRIGLQNFLHKNAAREELLSCLDAAVQGKKYYSELFLDRMFDLHENEALKGGISQLTASESEIVRFIAQGLTTKEIAVRKFLSFHTITTHRKNIFRKLGVSNASELTMVAVKTGIIETIDYHI